MTSKVCFCDKLQFTLHKNCLLLFNENQITMEKKPIPKLNNANVAMRTLQCYGLGFSCPAVEDIVFQLKETLKRL